MKTILALFTLCLPLLAQTPTDPPTPKLISVTRLESGTHAELTWTWQGPLHIVEHFQVMRHSPGIGINTRLVNPLKSDVKKSFVASKNLTTFRWVSKELDRTKAYSFELVVVVENAAGELVSSDVSNTFQLPITNN